jgi:hypothetical protein
MRPFRGFHIQRSDASQIRNLILSYLIQKKKKKKKDKNIKKKTTKLQKK